jgi:hypothetical protein
VLAAAVLIGPKLLKATDPGCSDFKGTALTSYNQLINDLNKQAPSVTLNSDIQAAVSKLTTAAGDAKNAGARSALNSLIANLGTVRTDVGKGSVPPSVEQSLNGAASAADSACGTL